MNLREDALRLQAELGGRALVCAPESGWPPELALRLEGEEPAYDRPCPYGNFAWVRSNDGPVADYRDLLTQAAVEPERPS